MNIPTLVIVCMLSASVAFGQAQGRLRDDPKVDWNPQMVRVADNYVPLPTGDHLMVRNRNGRVFNFSVLNNDGEMEVIPMADPTAMVIDDTVYVTGTCDTTLNANFLIYKSKDLVHWVPHKTAFHERFRNLPPSSGGSTVPRTLQPGDEERALRLNRLANYGDHLFIPSGGTTRAFGELWAPHLYRDPTDDTFVYLSFSARGLSTGSVQDPYDTLGRPTIYLARCLKSDFLLSYDQLSPNDDSKYFGTGSYGAGIDIYKYHFSTSNYMTAEPQPSSSSRHPLTT